MPKATDAMWSAGHGGDPAGGVAHRRRRARPCPSRSTTGGPFELVDPPITGRCGCSPATRSCGPTYASGGPGRSRRQRCSGGCCGPGARFLDVGANVGYFSLFAHRPRTSASRSTPSNRIRPSTASCRPTCGLTGSGADAQHGAWATSAACSPCPRRPRTRATRGSRRHTPDDRYDLARAGHHRRRAVRRPHLRRGQDRRAGVRAGGRPRHGADRPRVAGDRARSCSSGRRRSKSADWSRPRSSIATAAWDTTSQ